MQKSWTAWKQSWVSIKFSWKSSFLKTQVCWNETWFLTSAQITMRLKWQSGKFRPLLSRVQVSSPLKLKLCQILRTKSLATEQDIFRFTCHCGYRWPDFIPLKSYFSLPIACLLWRAYLSSSFIFVRCLFHYLMVSQDTICPAVEQELNVNKILGEAEILCIFLNT